MRKGKYNNQLKNIKITAIIEKGSAGKYSIYFEDDIDNYKFGGYGETLEVTKDDFISSIKEAEEMIKEAKGSASQSFENLNVVYKYD